MSVVAAAIVTSAAVGAYGANQAKKASNKAVDAQSAIADQELALAERQIGLAERTQAKQDALQDQMAPLYQQMMQQSIAQGQKDTARSDEAWQIYKDQFLPLENKLASTALNYDTQARRDEEAGRAVADVDMQFSRARTDLDRELAGTGLQPGSGAARALTTGLGIERAKTAAGAGTQARRLVEQTGIGLVDNAARLGRGQTSIGLQTAASAMGATGQAAGIAGQQQGQVNQNAGTVNGILGSAGASLGGASRSIGQAFQTSMAGINSSNAIIGDALGAAGLVAGKVWGANTGPGVTGGRSWP